MRIGSGRFKGRRLPATRGARPVASRLRNSLFSVLGPDLPGARVLDLCAGIGGFGLEALSRGAGSVVLIDMDRTKVRAINEWLREVGAADEGRAVGGNWLKGPMPRGPFDLVFLDPPYVTWSDVAMARETHVVGFERILEVIADDGLLVVKLPIQLESPSLAGWRELRRTPAGSSVYTIWMPEAPDSVKPTGLAADPQN